MDSDMKKHGLDRVLALTALSLALAGCSAGSNTLNDPSASSVVSTCTGTDCVPLEFTDDPVAGLNYTCGTVQNETDATGIATCHNDTDVTFYLKANAGARRVILGTVHVNAVRSVTDDEVTGGNSPLIRITPRDLVANPAALTSLEGSSAAAAINITRLLHALRERNVDASGLTLDTEAFPYVESAPVNRIVIKNSLKAGIDKLSEDVLATSFADGTFEAKLQPWLTSSKITLISVADAQARLMKTLKGLKAGLYFGSPAVTTPSVGSSAGTVLVDGVLVGINNLGLGVEGSQVGNNNQRTTMALYMMTDRSGFTIGQGLKWTGAAADTKEAYSLYINKDFVKMRPDNNESGFNPITNQVNNHFTWSTEASNTSPVQSVNFFQGTLIRDFVMSGSESLYRRYLGTGLASSAPVPAHSVGLWSQAEAVNSDGTSRTPAYSGTATLTKASSINTFLERAVWRTKDTVAAGEVYVFPLHATFNFTYGAGTVGCGPTGCTDLPSLGVTILENGDIITDRSADTATSAANCSPIDLATLKDAAGVQEYRIGTVRAAYQVLGASKFLSPLILLSGSQFGALDGLQIGSLALAPRAKLDVTEVAKATLGKPALPITNASTAAESAAGTADAVWANVYKSYTAVRVSDVAGDGPVITQARLQYKGVMTTQVSGCFTPQIK
jgi:hypothetical protein